MRCSAVAPASQVAAPVLPLCWRVGRRRSPLLFSRFWFPLCAPFAVHPSVTCCFLPPSAPSCCFGPSDSLASLPFLAYVARLRFRACFGGCLLRCFLVVTSCLSPSCLSTLCCVRVSAFSWCLLPVVTGCLLRVGPAAPLVCLRVSTPRSPFFPVFASFRPPCPRARARPTCLLAPCPPRHAPDSSPTAPPRLGPCRLLYVPPPLARFLVSRLSLPPLLRTFSAARALSVPFPCFVHLLVATAASAALGGSRPPCRHPLPRYAFRFWAATPPCGLARQGAWVVRSLTVLSR